MAEYLDAPPDVVSLAAELIAGWHQDLAGARIEFVFVKPTPKSKGRRILGRARKITGLNAHLARHASSDSLDTLAEPAPFFVIELARIPWTSMERSERLALLDHELSHCYVDDDGALALVPHDVEEFTAVLERRGAWTPDLEEFLAAGARQQRLGDDELAPRRKS